MSFYDISIFLIIKKVNVNMNFVNNNNNLVLKIQYISKYFNINTLSNITIYDKSYLDD